MTHALAGDRRRTILVILAVAAMILSALIPSSTDGSSHREAPLISEDPTADNTDLYAWRTDGDTVTIVANFIPLEEPAGGRRGRRSTPGRRRRHRHAGRQTRVRRC